MQCRCGTFFTQGRYPDNPDEDNCPKCRGNGSEDTTYDWPSSVPSDETLLNSIKGVSNND
jgi:hypothetical protein